MLSPLAADLREWRLRAGRPGDDALILPGEDGQPWSEPAYQSWRRRAFRRALVAALGKTETSAESWRERRCPKCKAMASQPCRTPKGAQATEPHADRLVPASVGVPYDLRHSFASLLLHEGRSVIYVARQLGHDARLTLTTYGHVIDELEDAPRQDARRFWLPVRAELPMSCPLHLPVQCK
jgi:integrase